MIRVQWDSTCPQHFNRRWFVSQAIWQIEWKVCDQQNVLHRNCSLSILSENLWKWLWIHHIDLSTCSTSEFSITASKPAGATFALKCFISKWKQATSMQRAVMVSMRAGLFGADKVLVKWVSMETDMLSYAKSGILEWMKQTAGHEIMGLDKERQCQHQCVHPVWGFTTQRKGFTCNAHVLLPLSV